MVLIFGSSGYIGSHLAEGLRRKGCEVMACSRKRKKAGEGNGNPPKSLARIFGQKVLDELSSGRVDIVINAAGSAHGKSGKKVQELYLANRDIPELIVKSCKDTGVKKVIHLSSISVCCETSSPEVLEENVVSREMSDYAKSKYEGERRFLAAVEATHMKGIALRVPLVYGAGCPGNFRKLFRYIAKGLPLPLAGAKGKRNFIYIENLCSAVQACMECDKLEGVCHVSDAEAVSTSELVRYVCGFHKKPCRLFHCPDVILHLIGYSGDLLEGVSGRAIPFSSDSMQKLTGDLRVGMKKFQNQTGWKPPFTVWDGLERANLLDD